MAGAVLWQADMGAEVFSSLTLKQAWGSKPGLLLGTQDGRSVCLDASNGSEMWTHHAASKAGILAAPGELSQPQLAVAAPCAECHEPTAGICRHLA